MEAAAMSQELTTLMLRNIPNDYTRKMFLELLDSKGLAGRYNFVYLPIDFNRMSGLGYGFVNFVSQADAQMARASLQGFSQWMVQSSKVCQVAWGEPLQGLEAHIERYRSSPVMHREVPDECKPVIFQDGVRVPFPAPTRRVRVPRSSRPWHA
jgi:RNA recognition motif-containing protein